MRKLRRGSSIALCAGALLLAGPSVLHAGFAFDPPPPYQPISMQHTQYGVSQFLLWNSSDDHNSYMLRLMNPGRQPMVVALLNYEGAHADFDSGPIAFTGYDDDIGDYMSCSYLVLPPHGGTRIDYDAWDGPDYPYVEILAVPVTPVQASFYSTRKADGLGIQGEFVAYDDSGARGVYLIHPNLFTMPADPTQRAAAVACMCGIAAAMGDFTLWIDFGIFCP